MISDLAFGIGVKIPQSKEESQSLVKGFKSDNLVIDEIIDTPNKEIGEMNTYSLCSSSPSSGLMNLEEIQAKFWMEINQIPSKFSFDSTDKLLLERSEAEKPRQKRKYVRKAKLMEELSDDEFENRQKMFVVDKNATLSQLIDETIVDSRKQAKRLQIKEELKNKGNFTSDDTESLSSFCNYKSETSETVEAKPSTFQSLLRKKCVNMKNCMWESQELDKFYNLLEFIGADFSLISSFLKTKTIGQIKKKYHQELKKNPNKINEALKKQSFKVGSNNYQYLLDLNKPQQNQIPDSIDDLNEQRIQFRQQALQTAQMIMMKGAIIKIIYIIQVYRFRNWGFSFNFISYNTDSTSCNILATSVSFSSFIPLSQLQMSCQLNLLFTLLIQMLIKTSIDIQLAFQRSQVNKYILQMGFQIQTQILNQLQMNQMQLLASKTHEFALKRQEQQPSQFFNTNKGIMTVSIFIFVRHVLQQFNEESKRYQQQLQHPMLYSKDLFQLQSFVKLAFSSQGKFLILIILITPPIIANLYTTYFNLRKYIYQQKQIQRSIHKVDNTQSQVQKDKIKSDLTKKLNLSSLSYLYKSILFISSLCAIVIVNVFKHHSQNNIFYFLIMCDRLQIIFEQAKIQNFIKYELPTANSHQL
ncbi:Myb-like DNA-binding domain protein (macronuclear) [Tetrahymena thermophila SB210]|uniref:Myb-like DNA-binding domain protein n=1 Tax=Tetrahymena thermophila (strain SB210) TaxID=312017 RepID=Q23K01_TETTS|nr:Myb-like DNA-binding domain protein [Tetrahymena thermophila SB210]EAR97042.3 Myb-like DNA-binding domain protein [Tetrahymena thermophila SB210]|eukprot:XP_001017287.3 Myb-like DNA-binding domain protein [Tetrahymena thermophila SB210]